MADADKSFDLQNLNPVFAQKMSTMLAAAKAAGINPGNIISGYRSVANQTEIYARSHQGKDFPAAQPGNSMHNFGLATDISSPDIQKLRDFANTHPEYGIYPLPGDTPHFQLAGNQHALMANPPQLPSGTSFNSATALSPYVGKGYSLINDNAKYASSPPGTRINAANVLVPGALADQGPESVGANPAYTFTLPKNAPMGMGNNNPLNIKYYPGAEKDHPGLIGPSSNTDQGDPQMKFASPEAGWNAAYNLLNKKYTNGKITPNQIIAGEGGWTPGNTQAAANVAKAAGIGPDDDIGFSDPAKAQKFMRALVTQEQGAAGAAYPDEMIAASIGGNAPATIAPTTGTAVAAAPAAAPADQSWWQKLVSPQTDAQGNPIAGGKSPLQQVAGELGGSRDKGSSLQQFKQAEEEEAPQGTVRNQAGQAPGSRNTSPMGGSLLPSVPQTYGQTINSLATPLTWTSAPPRAPQMPASGFQPTPGSQVPGMTLNTFQAPQGIGYGVDPNIGYGYG